MKLPNADNALIEQAKLVDYLLNTQHRRGASKAHVLHSFGYNPAQWQQLADDLRQYHCTADVTATRETPYGMRYEIRAILVTPSGRHITLRSVWQIDSGSSAPRLLTLFPD